MRKNYLIVLVLFSILLGGCSHGKINEGKNSNNQKKIQTESINTGQKNSKLSGIPLKKANLSGVNDYLNLLHLEKSGNHLLYVGTYLLEDTMILNEKMFRSIQEFQKLGSGLTEIEKKAFQKTLENYKKNLELQKEFMKSWADRQKCMQKILGKQTTKYLNNPVKNLNITKPKQEVTKPKQEVDRSKKNTTKPIKKSNGF